AISRSAPCQAELTRWHRTATSRPAPLAGTVLLLLALRSARWHRTAKYLCFTAGLVVKEYKEASFAGQMLRSIETNKQGKGKAQTQHEAGHSTALKAQKKMEYGEILNFTIQCDARINFC